MSIYKTKFICWELKKGGIFQPPTCYEKMISLLTISLAQSLMLFSRPTHSKAFSSFSCSYMPCACFMPSMSLSKRSCACLSMSARILQIEGRNSFIMSVTKNICKHIISCSFSLLVFIKLPNSLKPALLTRTSICKFNSCISEYIISSFWLF